MMPLTGKTVLITGAALRVGRSLSIAIAEQGADVIIHYLHSKDAAGQLQSDINEMGRKAYLLQADLSNMDAVKVLINKAVHMAPLYALVNNASIFEPLSWDNTSLEDWDRHIQINLTSPFILSQEFAKSLLPGTNGRIVNLLDWRALRPGADHFPYTISKAGLAAMTKSMAQALAPQISVNGLALGAILPPNDVQKNDSVLSQVPAGRWGSLEEVNKAMVFLLTGPDYITGEIIHIDGGRHLV
jgi:NAD(P)-dependent dehydrogenase (short-subunit alcohol dehydrogenase family)